MGPYTGQIGYNKKGTAPMIKVGIFGFHVRMMDPILYTKANIVNLIIHEQFHYEHHVTKAVEDLYNYSDTQIGQGDTAILNHLDAYHAQVTHESWEDTTEEFKARTIGYIDGFINAIENEEHKSAAKDFMDKALAE